MPLSLTQKESEYLDKLINKYQGYKKLSKSQATLLALGQIKLKSDDDIKNLRVLLRSEKKAELWANEQKQVQKVIHFQEEKKKKALQAKKDNLGAGLFKALENQAMINDTLSYADLIHIMVNQKLLDESLFADFLGQSSFGLEQASHATKPVKSKSVLESDNVSEALTTLEPNHISVPKDALSDEIDTSLDDLQLPIFSTTGVNGEVMSSTG